MWQKAVEPLVKEGKLVVVGVVQEQHPDRAKLYRQWRRFNWPIFVDSANFLDIAVVPIITAIDESGIVQHTRIRPNNIAADFVNVKYPRVAVSDAYNKAPAPDVRSAPTVAPSSTNVAELRALGDAHLLYSDRRLYLAIAIAAYEKAVTVDPTDGRSHFRLGVALRCRHDSPNRQPADAQRAVEQWGLALAANPNQYIWRRRIQQYGPRLDKPYNFYFWIAQARKDITARGETPIPLPTEPAGSELAPPGDSKSAPPTGSASAPRSDGSTDAADTREAANKHNAADKQEARSNHNAGNTHEAGNEHDAGNAAASMAKSCTTTTARIQHDTANMVIVNPVVTPARVQPGQRVRVRVLFDLDPRTKPYWNNEAEGLTVCIDLPEGVTLGEGVLSLANPQMSSSGSNSANPSGRADPANPAGPETQEPRAVEFELHIADTLPPQPATITPQPDPPAPHPDPTTPGTPTPTPGTDTPTPKRATPTPGTDTLTPKPDTATSGHAAQVTLIVPARALYYVCENKGGKCRYLRQEFTIPIQVDPNAPLIR